jgi:ABC-type amino acid transport substrate-binding protein
MKCLVSALSLYIFLNSPGVAGTLDDVRSSGVLHCGVDAAVPGYSAVKRNGGLTGLSADFCRALAEFAIGDETKVNFTVLKPDEQIEALQSGEIDVLVSALPVSMALQQSQGLMFGDPLYFDSVKDDVMAYAPLVRQADDGWFLTVNRLRNVLISSEFTRLEDQTGLGAEESERSAWQRTLQASGHYGQMFVRNFGPAHPRGKNQHVSKGGWLWTPLP